LSIACRAGKTSVADIRRRAAALVLLVDSCVGENHTYVMEYALKGDTARDCLLYLPRFQAVGNFDIGARRVNKKYRESAPVPILGAYERVFTKMNYPY
jgi:hypothetical protein